MYYIRTIWNSFFFLFLLLSFEFKGFFSSLNHGKSYKRITKLPQNKKVLVISYFPPHITGGIYRPLSWAKYASHCHWDIDFLTDDRRGPVNPVGKKLLDEVPANINIYKFHPDRNAAWQLEQRYELDGNFFSALLKVVYAIKKIKSSPVDIVVASGPPFSTFITGYYISRIFNRHLILDYRDEWSENPFSFVQKSKFGFFWEKRCQKHASKIVFTTNSMKEHNGSIFGKSMLEKSIVIKNGVDLSRLPEQPHISTNEKMEILFAGAIGRHTPFKLFNDIILDVIKIDSSLKNKIKITVLGDQLKDVVEEILSSPVGTMFNFEPQIPINEVIARVNKADASLIIASKDFERYIPGKLFYYMASARPIIVYGIPGEVSKIIEETKSGYFIELDNEKQLLNSLHEILERSSITDIKDERKDWVMKHTRENLAKSFFSKLDQLLK